MASNIVISGLRKKLSSSAWTVKEGFDVLRQLSLIASDPDYDHEAKELIIRSLQYRGELKEGENSLLDALTRHIGLFPYLDPETLPIIDQIAFEFHRPLNMEDEEIVLHSEQANAYRYLLEGNNVILSAPTSFGKSLLIDAIIESNKFTNIVVVVPTIALIDETRRRLQERFKDRYNIVTQLSQNPGKRNIFIMTQERVLSYQDFGNIDLFVIDEFYKLNPEQDPVRSYQLNQAFYKLKKTGAQFYLLGPSISGIPPDLGDNFQCIFIKSDFITVVSERIYISPIPSPEIATLRLCRKLNDPTLIYCKSPKSARKLTKYLVDSGIHQARDDLYDLANWLSKEYHPEWLLVKAILHGVGIHHGKLPRSIAQFLVQIFNKGILNILVCTSTLIEGVNTSAKNVIVYDNKIALKKLDFFTFSNICGRSGRMFHHYVGNVFILNQPPLEDFPYVDFPVFTQGEDTPNELLVQIEWEDLSDISKKKISPILKQKYLELDIIRANIGINPENQINLAQELMLNFNDYENYLYWANFPTYEELKVACQLIWDFLGANKIKSSSILSGPQLAFKIWRLYDVKDIRRLIQIEIDGGNDPDDSIENTLDFLKQWANYHFPKFLRALHRIQESVFIRQKREPGNYLHFADQVESWFMPATFIALEEYGIPYQITNKIAKDLGPLDDLDSILKHLKLLKNLEKYDLSGFEKNLIEYVQKSI
jgi:hypothetical protein